MILGWEIHFLCSWVILSYISPTKPRWAFFHVCKRILVYHLDNIVWFRNFGSRNSFLVSFILIWTIFHKSKMVALFLLLKNNIISEQKKISQIISKHLKLKKYDLIYGAVKTKRQTCIVNIFIIYNPCRAIFRDWHGRLTLSTWASPNYA